MLYLVGGLPCPDESQYPLVPLRQMVLLQRGWTWVLIECYLTQHFPRSRRFLPLRSPVREHHLLSSITKSILSEYFSSDRFHNKAFSALTSLLKTFPCFNLGASVYFAQKLYDEYIQTNVEHNFEVPRKGFAFTALTTKEQTAITLACTTHVTEELIGGFDATREKRAG